MGSLGARFGEVGKGLILPPPREAPPMEVGRRRMRGRIRPAGLGGLLAGCARSGFFYTHPAPLGINLGISFLACFTSWPKAPEICHFSGIRHQNNFSSISCSAGGRGPGPSRHGGDVAVVSLGAGATWVLVWSSTTGTWSGPPWAPDPWGFTPSGAQLSPLVGWGDCMGFWGAGGTPQHQNNDGHPHRGAPTPRSTHAKGHPHQGTPKPRDTHTGGPSDHTPSPPHP